jgi:two-component system cell cycle sensor histidine kinase/response regulator CckA
MSDVTTDAYYVVTSIAFCQLIRRRKDPPFNYVFFAFLTFIFACGCKHVLETWTLWHPDYWLAGSAKTLIYIASVTIAGLMIPLVPKPVALPGLDALMTVNIKPGQQFAERESGETELRLSKEQLRQQAELLDLAHDAIFVKNRDGVIVYWNRSAERTYGWSSEVALGQQSDKLLRARYTRPVRDIEVDVLSNGFWEGQVEHRCRDGAVLWMDSRWAAQRDSAGTVQAVMEINIDATLRKQHEIGMFHLTEELESQVSERTADLQNANSRLREEIEERSRIENVMEADDLKLRAILAAIDELCFEVDRNGTVLNVWASEDTSDFLIAKASVGKSIASYFCAEAIQDINAVVERVARNGRGESIVHTQNRPNGQRWYSSRLTPVRTPSGGIHSVCLLLRDITEIKTLEERLPQSEKMEAIGRLAGGISHDFNNILGVILGIGELLSKNLGIEHPQHKYVSQLLRSTESAASLTRQLLAFSRQQALNPRVISLNSIVTEVEQVIHHLIGEDIDLRTILEPSLANTRVDANEMQRVIMNLVNNARDAMPRGGTITIETANEVLDRTATPTQLHASAGSYAVLTVRDTGIGMNAETLAHVFEPFFTTKKSTKGTGLGLASVYGIVNQSDGFITATSTVGQGSCFKIQLPAFNEPSIPTVGMPLGCVEAPRSETVLLVEDSDELRSLVRGMLIAGGLEVYEASEAKEALAIIGHIEKPLHLLITDIVMPGGIDGHQLAQQLYEVYPRLKVLYITGYSQRSLHTRGDSTPAEQILHKPFNQATLLHRVAKLLRQARRQS